MDQIDEKATRACSDAVRFHYQVSVQKAWFQEGLPAEVQQILAHPSGELIVTVSDSALVLESSHHVTQVDLRSGRVVLLDLKAKTFMETSIPSPNAAASKPEEAAQWTTRVDSDDPSRMTLEAAGARLAIASCSIQIADRASRTFWDLLIPGAPKALHNSPPPRLLEIFGRAREPVVRLCLEKTEPAPRPEAAPPADFSAVQGHPIDPATSVRTGTRTKGVSPAIHRRRTELERLKGDARRLKDAHELRLEGQDIAWVLNQPVLDRVRAVANTFSTHMGRYRNPDDGSLGVELDLWPALSAMLQSGDFDQMPGFSSWDGAGTSLRPPIVQSALFFALLDGRMPVAARDEANGMTREEQSRFSDWLLEAWRDGLFRDLRTSADVDRVVQSFIESDIFRTAERMNEVGEAELRSMLRHSLTVPGPDGDPLSSLSGVLPDTTAEYRLLSYHLSNFSVLLAIDGEPVVQRLEYTDGAATLELKLPALSVGFNWSTNATASALSVALTLITAGGWPIWADNSGHWSLSVSARAAFDLVPEQVGRDIRRAIQIRALYNDERSDFSWTADPLISENPFNSEILWLIALFFERIFDWSGEWDAQLMGGVAEALDQLLREALRWPDVWLAAHAPRSFGSAALMATGSGAWEATLLNQGYILPSGVAASVDTTLADPVAVVVSDRYLNGWLQQRLRNRFGGFPFQTGVPLTELERDLDAPLPPPEALEAEDPAGDAGVHDLFARHPTVRCPNPPTAPPPQTEYRALLGRTEPRVFLPGSESAAYVGEFSMEFVLRVNAERTWQVPVIVSEGYDCVPFDLPDPRLDPGVIPRGSLHIIPEAPFFRGAGQGLRTPAGWSGHPHGVLTNIAQLQSGGLSGSGFQGAGAPGLPTNPSAGVPANSFPGGIPVPTVPEQPGLPQQGGRFCFVQCNWAYQTRRRSIATLLQIRATVTGRLLLDFDPDAYGDSGNGFFTGPLPGLRLTVARNADGSPDLSVRTQAPQLGGPWQDLDAELIERYFFNRVQTDAGNLFRDLTAGDAPRLAHTALPRNARIEGLTALPIRNLYELTRNLLTYRQAGSHEGANYLIRDNLVFWPLDLQETITAVFGAGDE